MDTLSRAKRQRRARLEHALLVFRLYDPWSHSTSTSGVRGVNNSWIFPSGRESGGNPGQARYFLFPVAIFEDSELHASSPLASPAPGHGAGFTWEQRWIGRGNGSGALSPASYRRLAQSAALPRTSSHHIRIAGLCSPCASPPSVPVLRGAKRFRLVIACGGA